MISHLAGNRSFTDRFIVLLCLQRNLILRFIWQYNCRIVCNWIVNGQKYKTHNNMLLCTRTASSNKEPIRQNVGAHKLPPRSISIISVQVPIELNIKHLYKLNTPDDILSGIIPLPVDHKIDHKCPKLLKIHLLNMGYDSIHAPRKIIIGKLQPTEIEHIESSNI